MSTAQPAAPVDARLVAPPAVAIHSPRQADGAHPARPADAAVPASPVEGSTADAGGAAAELVRLRGEIEQLDRAIVGLIADRVELARKVGPIKQALGMPILDPSREAAIVRRAGELAREAGLGDEDVRYIFWHLVGLCRRVQLEEG